MATYKGFIKLNAKIIFNNLYTECANCLAQSGKAPIRCPKTNENRIRSQINESNTSFALCSNSPFDIKNFEKLNAKLEGMRFVVDSLWAETERFRTENEKKYRRLVHNLSSLNAHNIQELYAVISQDSLHKSEDQFKVIENFIKINPKNSTKMFLQIMKNNAGIRTEIEMFQKLYKGERNYQGRPHKVHPILLNVLHVFFQDFTNKNVYVKIAPCEDRIKIDYESMRVALYHFFLNAEKYCAPNRDIQIYFNKDLAKRFITIIIDMISMKITDGDFEKMYEDDYSGEYARQSGKKGEGIGMGVISDLIAFNLGKFDVIRLNPGITLFELEGIPYEQNQFRIQLPSAPA